MVRRSDSRNEVEKTAHALIAKMGLEGDEDKVPCQLSGGQQQRASIARALAMGPDILFFDEPTSALDPELTGEVLKVLKQLAAERTTMIIVTHEMALAHDVATRVVFVERRHNCGAGHACTSYGQPQTSTRTKEFLSRYSG